MIFYSTVKRRKMEEDKEKFLCPSDYFLLGVIIGTYLDWFTTLVLTLLYILYYNKTIAGIESQAIARYFVQRVKGIVGDINSSSEEKEGKGRKKRGKKE